MTKHNYPQYGLAIAGGAGIAVWAGFPPTLLLLLLVCPLMMFFMMRGMHGGQNNHEAPQDRDDDVRIPGSDRETVLGSRRPSPPDGSHERIDHP